MEKIETASSNSDPDDLEQSNRETLLYTALWTKYQQYLAYLNRQEQLRENAREISFLDDPKRFEYLKRENETQDPIETELIVKKTQKRSKDAIRIQNTCPKSLPKRTREVAIPDTFEPPVKRNQTEQLSLLPSVSKCASKTQTPLAPIATDSIATRQGTGTKKITLSEVDQYCRERANTVTKFQNLKSRISSIKSGKFVAKKKRAKNKMTA